MLYEGTAGAVGRWSRGTAVGRWSRISQPYAQAHGVWTLARGDYRKGLEPERKKPARSYALHHKFHGFRRKETVNLFGIKRRRPVWAVLPGAPRVGRIAGRRGASTLPGAADLLFTIKLMSRSINSHGFQRKIISATHSSITAYAYESEPGLWYGFMGIPMELLVWPNGFASSHGFDHKSSHWLCACQ